MNEIKTKAIRQKRRLARSRKRIREQVKLPRLSVNRSNKYFSAQIIDDLRGVTLVSAHEKELDITPAATKSQKSAELGKLLANKAKAAKVLEVVFDKGSYRYHGRVSTFATGAREGGLKF